MHEVPGQWSNLDIISKPCMYCLCRVISPHIMTTAIMIMNTADRSTSCLKEPKALLACSNSCIPVIPPKSLHNHCPRVETKHNEDCCEKSHDDGKISNVGCLGRFRKVLAEVLLKWPSGSLFSVRVRKVAWLNVPVASIWLQFV